MPRHFRDDFRHGQLLTRLVVRAKCRYGPSHESVRLVGDVWFGEDTADDACYLAEPDVCEVCAGLGRVPLSDEELAAESANAASTVRDKPCEPCQATGQVPGPHWPWRHDHPGPLPPRSMR